MRKRMGIRVISTVPGEGRDRHGNPLPDTVSERVELVYGVAPSVSAENAYGVGADQHRPEAGREAYNLYAPVDTTIQAGDKVVWRGRAFDVSGHPQVWDHNPVGPGRLAGVVIRLEARHG